MKRLVAVERFVDERHRTNPADTVLRGANHAWLGGLFCFKVEEARNNLQIVFHAMVDLLEHCRPLDKRILKILGTL